MSASAFGPDNCTSEDCEAIGDVTLQCPFDSDLIVNSTGATTRSLCVCNHSYCTVPVCAAGFESVLLNPADLRPGSCCDEFVCKRTGKTEDYTSHLTTDTLGIGDHLSVFVKLSSEINILFPFSLHHCPSGLPTQPAFLARAGNSLHALFGYVTCIVFSVVILDFFLRPK